MHWRLSSSSVLLVTENKIVLQYLVNSFLYSGILWEMFHFWSTRSWKYPRGTLGALWETLWKLICIFIKFIYKCLHFLSCSLHLFTPGENEAGKNSVKCAVLAVVWQQSYLRSRSENSQAFFSFFFFFFSENDTQIPYRNYMKDLTLLSRCRLFMVPEQICWREKACFHVLQDPEKRNIFT